MYFKKMGRPPRQQDLLELVRAELLVDHLPDNFIRGHGS